MTPMIDVVFLLLVFFVCASIGRDPEKLLSTPLSGGAVAAAEIDPQDLPLGDVRIQLVRDGDTTTATVAATVHHDPRTLEAQLVALANISADVPVILSVDPDVPMEDVLRVYHTARRAGFQTVQFAAKG